MHAQKVLEVFSTRSLQRKEFDPFTAPTKSLNDLRGQRAGSLCLFHFTLLLRYNNNLLRSTVCNVNFQFQRALSFPSTGLTHSTFSFLPPTHCWLDFCKCKKHSLILSQLSIRLVVKAANTTTQAELLSLDPNTTAKMQNFRHDKALPTVAVVCVQEAKFVATVDP